MVHLPSSGGLHSTDNATYLNRMNHTEPKIGIQLYSVREALGQDFNGVLSQLAEMGYQGVEFAQNYGGLEPENLAALLKQNGLAAIGIYDKISHLADPEAEVYRQANALQCTNLAFGFSLQSLEEEWDQSLQLCQEAVEAASRNGCRLCYHAHAHEFKKRDGVYYLDRLLNAPGLEKMQFEADTCWIYRGGEDVVGYMEKYASRIPLLHVKDTTTDDMFTEIGRGVIDFTPVIDFARRHGIPWIGYEQDQTQLPGLESARISLENLKQVMGRR